MPVNQSINITHIMSYCSFYICRDDYYVCYIIFTPYFLVIWKGNVFTWTTAVMFKPSIYFNVLESKHKMVQIKRYLLLKYYSMEPFISLGLFKELRILIINFMSEYRQTCDKRETHRGVACYRT